MIEILPAVFVQDCAWMVVVAGLSRLTDSRKVRALLAVMLGYVCCEALFHVYMERVASVVMGW